MADQLDYAGERDADVPVDDLVEGIDICTSPLERFTGLAVYLASSMAAGEGGMTCGIVNSGKDEEDVRAGARRRAVSRAAAVVSCGRKEPRPAPSASGRAFARTGMREAQVDRPEEEGAAARPPCSGSIGKSRPMSRKSAMTKGDLYRFCKYKTKRVKSYMAEMTIVSLQ